MNKTKFALLSVFLLSVSACDIPILVRYEGPPKPKSSIAILYQKHDEGWLIDEVDHEDIANNLITWSGNAGVQEIRLLPGKHSINGWITQGVYRARFDINVSLQAGKEYQLTYTLPEDEPNKVQVQILDLSEELETRDVFVR